VDCNITGLREWLNMAAGKPSGHRPGPWPEFYLPFIEDDQAAELRLCLALDARERVRRAV
jgi:hypothetical protein